jgi:hypothetical protein
MLGQDLHDEEGIGKGLEIKLRKRRFTMLTFQKTKYSTFFTVPLS